MREIKFRGKDAITGEWVCGYYRKINYDMNVIYTFDDKEIKIMAGSQGEYTEFKDENKKEIYEGDIIWRYIKAKEKSTGEIREVYNDKKLVKWGVWENGEYGYRINTWMIGIEYLSEYEKYSNPFWDVIEEKFEIIGNKFDNPELMEEK